MASYHEFKNNERLLWERLDIINSYITDIEKANNANDVKDIIEMLNLKMVLPFNVSDIITGSNEANDSIEQLEDLTLLKAELIKQLKRYARSIKKNVKILNSISKRYEQMTNAEQQKINKLNNDINEYNKGLTELLNAMEFNSDKITTKEINKVIDKLVNVFKAPGKSSYIPLFHNSINLLMETVYKIVSMDNIKPYARKLNDLMKSIIKYFSMATDDAIKKKTTRQLYDLIIDYIKVLDEKVFNNTDLNKLYKLHHQLINRTLKQDEYKKVIDELIKLIPRDDMVIIDGKIDYMRSVNKRIDKVKTELVEQTKDLIDEPQYYELDQDAINVYLSSDNLKEGDKSKKSVLKALKQKFLIDSTMSKNDINKLITRKIESDTGLCCLEINNIKLIPVEHKERVNDAINGECVKIALNALGINTITSEFDKVITDNKITSNVGFYNVYNNLMLGNPNTNKKILVYNHHAIAYNDNTGNKIETIEIKANKYNQLIDDIKTYNIPNRSLSDGYVECFIEEGHNKRSFNRKYHKPLNGAWFAFRLVIDDMEVVNEELKKEHEEKEALDAEFIEFKNSFIQVLLNDIRTKNGYIKDSENSDNVKLSAYVVPFFGYDYRRRVGYSKFIKGNYYELDMVKAYYTALKELKNILLVSNIPTTTPQTKNYIVYCISSVIPCGYYPKDAIKVLLTMDPLAVFEYYEVYNVITDLTALKRNLTNYKVSIGKLISLSQEYVLKDENNNIGLNKVYYGLDYCGLLHLNIILFKNSIMLKEIYENYKNGLLPVGYNIDAIYYDTFIDKHSKYFHDCHEIYKECDNITNLHLDEVIDNKIKPAINCIFGVAGSGKSTEIMNLYRDNETVIVNSYNLQRLYKKHSIDAVLYQLFAIQYKPIYTTKIYIDEIFTFSRHDIEVMLSIAGKYNIEITLIGDYNQLLPTCPNTPINNLPRTLQCINHVYKYDNYRNGFIYNEIHSWLLDFEHQNADKQEQLINKLVKAGYIGIDNKNICFRWYKQDAIDNEKLYNGKYWILRNYSDTIPAYVKRVFSTDCVYTIDEIERIQNEYKINAIKYFVNNNAISFYNTQGQTLDHMDVINAETLNKIRSNPRMFYVFVSRLTIKEL